jgi:sulfate transporter 3
MTTTSAEIAGMAVHKVAPPPPQSTASKMKARVKETFFPDDPFRAFKGQPLGTQWLMAVKYLLPILDWAPSYSFSLFKSDLISGLTIASLAIPQARMHLLPASLASHQNRFLSRKEYYCGTSCL